MSRPAAIAEVIAAEGGRVSFARFMELALTHPTLGYYSQVDRLLRHGGDFNTAPALSPFFNRTLARLVTELLDASIAARAGDPEGDAALGSAGDRSGAPGGDLAGAPGPAGDRLSVVESGGGEGQLAATILGRWQCERPELRGMVAYRLVEIGARLRQRQAEAVAQPAAGGWDVGWGTTLAEACAGTKPAVIVGNEFVDTMPVHLVRVAGAVPEEVYVREAPSGGLAQMWGPLSPEAEEEMALLFGDSDPGRLRGLSADGVVEVADGLAAFVRQAAEVMPAGSLVTVDYGDWFPGVPKVGERWGLEDRVPRRRTVRGYFKHQLVLDPLARPGRQDLTADVDFAALDMHGRREGFETVLFTTLSAFLRAGGAEAELAALEAGGCGCGDHTLLRGDGGWGGACGEQALEADRQATVLRNLLDERDLGGAFKVMVQVREGQAALR